MRRAQMLWAMLTVLAVGCAREDSSPAGGAWRGTTETSGDTLKVHTVSGFVRGELGALPAESLEIVYAGEGVLRSTAVAMAGERLLIGERTQIVEIGAPGEMDTLGRKGDGPREFRQIRGLAGRGDSILVLDANANRLTLLVGGRVRTTTTVSAPDGYEGMLSSTLGRCKEGVLVLWGRGKVARGGPPDTVAVVWWVPGAAPHPWEMVEDISWTEGEVPGTRRPFGPRALIANDGGCRVATSDGVGYSIRVRDAASNTVTLISVNEAAPPVTDDSKTIPDQWRGELPGPFLSPMLSLLEAQEYGATRNQIEELRFDALGRIWARVVDSTYQYHPFIMARVPEARPPTYRWDVFGTDGKRLAVVHLPSNFSPKAWAGRWVYGITEQEDGTLVVGRLPVPSGLN
jgi:hypothetical protein